MYHRDAVVVVSDFRLHQNGRSVMTDDFCIDEAFGEQFPESGHPFRDHCVIFAFQVDHGDLAVHILNILIPYYYMVYPSTSTLATSR